MKMFSVNDSKSETFYNPMYFKTPAEAIRAFETTCKDSESIFAKYPSDFTLVELGEFNEQDATITTHAKPRILANASEFVQKIQKQQLFTDDVDRN